jgi:predicted dehydrogenase/threonine dehydrogenase-like Zn-dependent dehydrogenase
MKQILQNLSSGTTIILDAPVHHALQNQMLVNTSVTLISAGTERMLVNFGKSSYFEKARQQPEKVKMVLEKVKTNGFMATMDAVRSKLEQPLELGYCNVGVISKIDSRITNFKVGDRIVSNGPHADIVKVPANLCALIPNNVDDESAVFTVVASIGLQGIRLAAPTLGEAVVVIGAGLIGLLTVQLLKAQGCRVLAIDFDESKLELARQFGAETCNPQAGEDPLSAAFAFSRGHGIDAALITASTKSSDPITLAAHMSRKRGRIVLVGVTGLELNRADFYEKELTFQVSCSYGPGRYEPNYEKQGLDYPIGFVRWTEQRNFEACLDMMASGQLNVKPLITHRYLFEDAEKAYQTLTEDKSALGIILKYTSDPVLRVKEVVTLKPQQTFDASKPVLGFIGAGNYASRILIPAFKASGAQLHSIVSSGGVNSVVHGKRVGFIQALSNVDNMFADKSVNAAVIVTRHNTHASLVCKALRAGKHVFVEKPLAISLEELAEVEAIYHTTVISQKQLHLMVGFNRRFAPHVQKMKALLTPIKAPKSFIMTINAGAISSDHWTQDSTIGGGRIIGEACHFIDLMRYLAGSEIISAEARRIGKTPYLDVTEDNASITLGFADGSFGTIHYLANGAASFPKERIEVFTSGRILQLDNFRKLKGFGWPGFQKMNQWRQDKGQRACASAFLSAIEQGSTSPIPVDEIFEVARVTIEIAMRLRQQ